jgi:hypothetical protein
MEAKLQRVNSTVQSKGINVGKQRTQEVLPNSLLLLVVEVVCISKVSACRFKDSDFHEFLGATDVSPHKP